MTFEKKCSVPNPWTPRLLVAQLQIHGHQDFSLLGSKSMDTKTSGCLVPNPWTPRLLVAWFQIHGHQDFSLLGSKSMDTKTFGCSAPNPWTPRLLIARLQIHGHQDCLFAWFQIRGHQDFWLRGSKSMNTKTYRRSAPNLWTPRLLVA